MNDVVALATANEQAEAQASAGRLLKAGRRVEAWASALDLPLGRFNPVLRSRPVAIQRCPSCDHWYLARVYRCVEHEREQCIAMGRNPDTALMRKRLAASISRASQCELCLAQRQQQQLRASKERRKRQRQQATASRVAVCEHCSAVFQVKRSTARFCSARCRTAAHRSTQAWDDHLGLSCSQWVSS